MRFAAANHIHMELKKSINVMLTTYKVDLGPIFNECKKIK